MSGGDLDEFIAKWTGAAKRSPAGVIDGDHPAGMGGQKSPLIGFESVNSNRLLWIIPDHRNASSKRPFGKSYVIELVPGNKLILPTEKTAPESHQVALSDCRGHPYGGGADIRSEPFNLLTFGKAIGDGVEQFVSCGPQPSPQPAEDECDCPIEHSNN